MELGESSGQEDREGRTVLLHLDSIQQGRSLPAYFLLLEEDSNAPAGKVPPPLPHSSSSKLTSVVSCQKYL